MLHNSRAIEISLGALVERLYDTEFAKHANCFQQQKHYCEKSVRVTTRRDDWILSSSLLYWGFDNVINLVPD